MRLFFIIFFLLYGGMHLLAFIRARAALQFGPVTDALIAIFMLFMCFTPVLVRLSEGYCHDLTARVLSVVGYTWMGVLFLFCSCSLAVDIWRAGVRISGAVMKTDLSSYSPSVSLRFFMPLVVSIVLFIYGYFEARYIRTEHFVIKTSKLPPSMRKLRIVQISDVHLGLIVRQYKLARMLEIVKEAGPDILVCTGDLVDGQINGIAGLAGMLDSIRPKYGKYAVVGNHEYIAGFDQAVKFIQLAGFRLLRGEGVTIPGVINIAGVDDITGKWNGIYRSVSEKDILSSLSPYQFTLLLKHRPLIENGSAGLFDLQLSGHTHKGQIFPFSLITYFYYPVHAGLSDAGNHSKIYVSRGTGTWGPPIRVLSPPEVTVIDLVN